MYSVEWDLETGGIILKSNSENSLIVPPRPVFHEELNLLGFQKYWDFEPRKEPLLWSIGRRYFYRGELVAEARGGNYYSLPEIEIYKKNVTLNPVDVQAMLNKNKKILESLTQASLDFIFKTHERFVRTVDVVAVAFSGGKDSVVLLDLVQRVLKPDDYYVIFNDTTMELSDTYRIVEKAKERWSHLLFFTAKSHKDALTTWKEFGPPSRIHRWCCTVHKSVPTLLFLRELLQKPNAKALIFDGVRGDESLRRSSYNQISQGKKHITQTNVTPLLRWNVAEVFLYIFYRDLPLNKAYRYGLNRVGCKVCPYLSPWSEAILGRAYYKEILPYLKIITEYALAVKNDSEKAKVYIERGSWKSRAGGMYLTNGGNRVSVLENESYLICEIENFNNEWFDWLKTFSNDLVRSNGKGYFTFNEKKIDFKIEKTDSNKAKIEININNEYKSTLKKLITSISLKTSYCLRCKACMVECPNGAIEIDKKLIIEPSKCKRCGSCSRLAGKTYCYAAASLMISKGGIKMKEGFEKLPPYQTFGFRREWLLRLFEEGEFDPNKWKIGNRQKESFIQWLKHSEIIEKTSNLRAVQLTKFGEAIRKIVKTNEACVWAIIWNNLVRNSTLCKWYALHIPWDSRFSKEELKEILSLHYSNSDRSLTNSLTALINTFKETPIGNELGIGKIEKSQKHSIIHKAPWKNPLPEAILYSVYRYAEIKNKYQLTLKEFYTESALEGPFVVFGITEEDLRKILRNLAVSLNELLKVEFAYDLDNIFLNSEITSLKLLDYF
ncbi:MAG: phosphoadenosine phosphosulfate reductase family protein [Nitrososphaeria archaeon]